MDISKLTGLGILGYLLLTSKMKVELGPSYKDLEDKTKDLEEKLKETYEELDQYTEKEEDLVIKPELHIDINGGFAMSYLYLNIKNNSTKLSYKIGDFSARAITTLAYTANTFEPKKIQTLTIKPGKSYRLLIWSRSFFEKPLNYINTPENLVFIPPQSDYFHEDALNEISNFPETYKIHKRDVNLVTNDPEFGRMMCYEFPTGITIKQLNATVYSSNDEKQDVILNDIKGSLLIYTTYQGEKIASDFPGYKFFTKNDGYAYALSSFGGSITKKLEQQIYANYYYNPETKLWESAEHEWIGENTHVFK